MKEIIENAAHIVVIQAENPDADSLASSLALEEVFSELGKKATLYCPVSMPRHLRHIEGWDRVVSELPRQFDASVIVDAGTMSLLVKVFTPEQTGIITSRPIIIIDHHDTPSDIPYEVTNLSDASAASAGQLIYRLVNENKWTLSDQARNMIAISIMADTLGLTTSAVTPQTLHTMAELVESGVQLHVLDEQRRAMLKRPIEITHYKGQLLQRIELAAHGEIAIIDIPWSEIEEFSEKYNPSNLVIEDMRLIEGVRLAVAFKTYPDGHVTGKLRANADAPVAGAIAEAMGGGGHQYAAGFKVYDTELEDIKQKFVTTAMGLLKQS